MATIGTTVSAKVCTSVRKRMQSAVTASGTRWKTVSDFQREAIERMLQEVESATGGQAQKPKPQQRPAVGESDTNLPRDEIDAGKDARKLDVAETRSSAAFADREESYRARPKSEEIGSYAAMRRSLDGILKSVREQHMRRGLGLRIRKARDEDRAR